MCIQPMCSGWNVHRPGGWLWVCVPPAVGRKDLPDRWVLVCMLKYSTSTTACQIYWEMDFCSHFLFVPKPNKWPLGHRHDCSPLWITVFWDLNWQPATWALCPEYKLSISRMSWQLLTAWCLFCQWLYELLVCLYPAVCLSLAVVCLYRFHSCKRTWRNKARKWITN